MRAIGLLLALAACGSESAPSGVIDYQVVGYDVAVDLIDERATIDIDFDVIVGGDCLSIPSRVAPTGARWNGKDVASGEHDGASLTLCGKGVAHERPLRISVDADLPRETWGDTQVGFSVTDDIEGAPFRYLVSWVGGCDRFGPCDSAPDRFASYRFTVTHDDNERVLCPGVISAAEPGLTVCDTDFTAPTYSAFGLAASSSWTESTIGSWGGIEVTFFDMASSGTAERLRSDVHDSFMTWMQERFGAYPYGDSLRLAVGPTVWSGFEHPGNIMLNDDLRNSPLGGGYEDRLTHVVNHELAHMWAGNRTTLASTKDFVWKEAVVEYLGFAFEDEVLGAATAKSTALAWKAFSRGEEYYPSPTEDVDLVDFYGAAYGPGPMILFRQLEAFYGRDAILAAIGEILAEPGAVGLNEVREALETSTDADLGDYLNQWLFGSGAPTWPQFNVEVEQTGAVATVTVTQVAPAEPMGCAFAIELQGTEGETAELWIDRGLAGAILTEDTLEVDFEVISWRLDPEGHALAYSPQATNQPARNPWIAR